VSATPDPSDSARVVDKKAGPSSILALEGLIMSNKALALIHAVSPTSQDLGFRDRAKERPKDFTRDGKVGFVGVLSIV